MHNAPSVTYPVGRSFFLAAVLSGLALLSAGLGAVWISASGRFGGAQLLMLLCWLLAASLAVWSWRLAAQGELQWDGQVWLWRSGATTYSGQVTVRLDWQRGMLLAFVDRAGRTQWLWLARGTDPVRWPALRRALYAAPGRQASPLDAGELAL